MNIPSTETALQKEMRLFGELFTRLINTLLNRMFDLRPAKATRRAAYLFVLFFISGFVISLFYYSPSKWVDHISNILGSLLSTASTPADLETAINNFIRFLILVIQDPRILQYLPVFLAPFFIALQSAATYLADVFELEEISVARRFIWGVALTGSNETIRISHGDIADENRGSPLYLIGGPGKVIVDLDSVALFERADGTPHLIGPTGKETGGRATLEGFERLRHALDIRDHYITLQDQDDKSKAVQSRSLDGIPIKATDVHLMFSVFRGDNSESSADYPYPFSKEAVEKIAYKAESLVTPEQINPSTFKLFWANNIVKLIRNRLGEFMSQHRLTEYLASIGIPEIEKAKQREDKIAEEKQKLTQSDDDIAKQQEMKLPDFQARYEIKNLFNQFAEQFTSKAHDHGVELYWIGLGTWEAPVEVLENHLEAWKISQENLKYDSQEAIDRIEQKESLIKMKELILKVPINVYYDEILGTPYEPRRSTFRKKGSHMDEHLSKNEVKDNEEMVTYRMQILRDKMSRSDEDAHEHVDKKEIDHKSDHKKDLKTLLVGYRNQLVETADIINNKNDENNPAPPIIRDAIELLSKTLGYPDYHWVGKSKPETKSDQPEAELYEILVNMVGGDRATADKWIEYELKRYPNETRSQLIQHAIDSLKRGK